MSGVSMTAQSRRSAPHLDVSDAQRRIHHRSRIDASVLHRCTRKDVSDANPAGTGVRAGVADVMTQNIEPPWRDSVVLGRTSLR
jgi:hypothetical protein